MDLSWWLWGELSHFSEHSNKPDMLCHALLGFRYQEQGMPNLKKHQNAANQMLFSNWKISKWVLIWESYHTYLQSKDIKFKYIYTCLLIHLHIKNIYTYICISIQGKHTPINICMCKYGLLFLKMQLLMYLHHCIYIDMWLLFYFSLYFS